MHALPHVVDLFPHKLPRRRRLRFAFRQILFRSLQSFPFFLIRHDNLPSPSLTGMSQRSQRFAGPEPAPCTLHPSVSPLF
jgi:hypothetical protein